MYACKGKLPINLQLFNRFLVDQNFPCGYNAKFPLFTYSCCIAVHVCLSCSFFNEMDDI